MAPVQNICTDPSHPPIVQGLGQETLYKVVLRLQGGAQSKQVRGDLSSVVTSRAEVTPPNRARPSSDGRESPRATSRG